MLGLRNALNLRPQAPSPDCNGGQRGFPKCLLTQWSSERLYKEHDILYARLRHSEHVIINISRLRAFTMQRNKDRKGGRRGGKERGKKEKRKRKWGRRREGKNLFVFNLVFPKLT